MFTNIDKKTEDFIIENLNCYPFRGLITEIAGEIGQSRQSVWQKVHFRRNKVLLNLLHQKAQTKMQVAQQSA